MIQDRDSERAFFLKVWEKHNKNMPLEMLEKMVLGVILQHPEYHAILERDEKEISEMEFTAEIGMTNPFLHMSMHIAIQEQIDANRPLGITELYKKLLVKYLSVHDLEHNMMKCFGEILLRAQKNNTLPDEIRYLEQVRCL